MKKYLFVFLFLSSLMIVSCAKKEKDPKAVLSDFFDAVSKKDFAKAKTFATPNSAKLLDELEKTGINNPGDFEELNKEHIVFNNTEMRGDTALVSVSSKKNASDKMIYILYKQNGEWKVAWEKEALLVNALKSMKETKTDKDSTGEINNTQADSTNH